MEDHGSNKTVVVTTVEPEVEVVVAADAVVLIRGVGGVEVPKVSLVMVKMPARSVHVKVEFRDVSIVVRWAILHGSAHTRTKATNVSIVVSTGTYRRIALTSKAAEIENGNLTQGKKF